MTSVVAGQRRKGALRTDAESASELMARIADGDAAAFATFYDLLASRMFRLVVSVVEDSEIACDVTRDAFNDIWAQASRCPTGEDRPAAWALGMAYRRARERVQATAAGGGRSRNRSGSTVGGLTADQHAAFTLSYYGALTWDQAAGATAAPAHAIARAQRDALVRLRDITTTPA